VQCGKSRIFPADLKGTRPQPRREAIPSNLSSAKFSVGHSRWHNQTSEELPPTDPHPALWDTPMKTFLLRFFTWWNGQTFGTQFWTWRYGEFVGEDEFGNRYFRTTGGKIDSTVGFERRWVIYNGVAEASTVPPSWHGWLHHTVDVPPTQERVTPRPWWKPHRPNLTGTPRAHRPTGSILAQGRRPKATGDYKAWTPDR
jgi:NADH:ubiquinone oxidoreductase subunit